MKKIIRDYKELKKVVNQLGRVAKSLAFSKKEADDIRRLKNKKLKDSDLGVYLITVSTRQEVTHPLDDGSSVMYWTNLEDVLSFIRFDTVAQISGDYIKDRDDYQEYTIYHVKAPNIKLLDPEDDFSFLEIGEIVGEIKYNPISHHYDPEVPEYFKVDDSNPYDALNLFTDHYHKGDDFSNWIMAIFDKLDAHPDFEMTADDEGYIKKLFDQGYLRDAFESLEQLAEDFEFNFNN